MMAGTAPPTPSVDSLPAMTSSVPSMVPSARASAQPVWMTSEPCMPVVEQVDGLVGAHRQRLADRLGGALRARGQQGHRALGAVGGLFLPDQQRLFDGALVDLVQHGVGGLTVQGPVAVGELALRPGVWDLLDQDHDVRHECRFVLLERALQPPAARLRSRLVRPAHACY